MVIVIVITIIGNERLQQFFNRQASIFCVRARAALNDIAIQLYIYIYRERERCIHLVFRRIDYASIFGFRVKSMLLCSAPSA